MFFGFLHFHTALSDDCLLGKFIRSLLPGELQAHHSALAVKLAPQGCGTLSSNIYAGDPPLGLSKDKRMMNRFGNRARSGRSAQQREPTDEIGMR